MPLHITDLLNCIMIARCEPKVQQLWCEMSSSHTVSKLQSCVVLDIINTSQAQTQPRKT